LVERFGQQLARRDDSGETPLGIDGIEVEDAFLETRSADDLQRLADGLVHPERGRTRAQKLREGSREMLG